MDIKNTSFAELYGIPLLKIETEKSGLVEWYERIYDVPFSRFSVEDLARSCRQNLFPEHIVPRVLRTLRQDPLAGELYEEELWDSLALLPDSFWQNTPQCGKDLVEIFDDWKKFLSDSLEPTDFARLQNFVSIVEQFVQ